MEVRFNIESYISSSPIMKHADRYTFRWIRGLTPFYKYTIGSVEVRSFGYMISVGFTFNKSIFKMKG